MGFSRQLTASLAAYLVKNRVRGRERFPLVLMLEPTFRCNLACAGCGRIREYRDILDEMLSVDECLSAAEESRAPVVSITGGEPLLHPGIGPLVEQLVAMRRFVHLCTNGLLLQESLGKFRPSPYLSFVLHLDGLAGTHDRFAGRSGVFDRAVGAMRAAAGAGFRVLVNTTIYKGTDLEEVKQLLRLLSGIPVDGVMLAPAFGYQAVDNDVFLDHTQAVAALREIIDLRERFPFYNTPLYLDFLAGRRELDCVPWSTPTRNPRGWKRPCYLITDGHAASFQELMEETPWEAYGPGHDPRCANCMVHCGFEASAIDALTRHPSDLWRTLTWTLDRR
jgi:hopanoid biosynthesis associated radical SAM protein HpnH